jgi:dTDP-4-amino-4,6-dideoxygalactose transaminase
MEKLKARQLEDDIRLSKSIVGLEEKEALERVIDYGYLGMGKEVQLFELELKEFLGTGLDVICVSSGTAALHMAMTAMDIGPGDEVLVPTITYLASFQAISATGAKPIACDVNENTLFIDLKDAEKRLTEKTKAVMPIHYASDSQGIPSVYEFAKKNNLRVIEDAAHSFGCKRQNETIGVSGDVICFSFDGIKNITSGEGGAVLTSDPIVKKRIQDARLLGVESDTEKRFAGERSWAFDVKYQGWRYHMSDLMAAIGRAQLKKFDSFSKKRKEILNIYISRLSSLKNLKVLEFDYKSITPHIFPVRVLNGKRDNLIKALKDKGIQSGIHYQPNHLLSLYKTEYELPVAEKVYKEIISIPLHPDLNEVDLFRITDLIKEIIEQ